MLLYRCVCNRVSWFLRSSSSSLAKPAESGQLPEFNFSRRHRTPRTCPDDLYMAQRRRAASRRNPCRGLT